MSYDALRRGRHSASNQTYHVTIVTAGRLCHFADFDTARAVIAEMRQLNDRHIVDSFAWVLMPDHLHWLFQLRESQDLATAIKTLKGRSTRAISRKLRRRGALWQRAYHDRAVRRDEDLVAIARYIVSNPLRAGLVERLGDYPLWDAIWL
jgi:putative transposase